MTTAGDRYRVSTSDDGSVVGLWQRREVELVESFTQFEACSRFAGSNASVRAL